MTQPKSTDITCDKRVVLAPGFREEEAMPHLGVNLELDKDEGMVTISQGEDIVVMFEPEARHLARWFYEEGFLDNYCEHCKGVYPTARKRQRCCCMRDD